MGWAWTGLDGDPFTLPQRAAAAIETGLRHLTFQALLKRAMDAFEALTPEQVRAREYGPTEEDEARSAARRDLFAAAALQGLLASGLNPNTGSYERDYDVFADTAWALAEAMLFREPK